MIWRHRPIKVALVGCGGIGQTHLKHLLKLPQYDLVATVDSDRERAWQSAVRFRARRHYVSLTDALADTDIELVVIATPPLLHEPQVIDSLRAGKHVFCDKPLALSLESADRMIREAQVASRLLVVGQMMRFWRNVELAREFIAAGRIGEIRHVARRRFVFQPDAGDRSWARDPEQTGGWVFFGNGVHEVDAVLYMTGSVITDVFIYGACNNTYWNDIDEKEALFRLENGAIGCFSHSLNSEYLCETAIMGTKGSLFLSDWHRGLSLNREPQKFRATDGFAEQLIELALSIRRGEPHRCEATSNRATLAVLEAMQKAIKTGQQARVVLPPLRTEPVE